MTTNTQKTASRRSGIPAVATPALEARTCDNDTAADRTTPLTTLGRKTMTLAALTTLGTLTLYQGTDIDLPSATTCSAIFIGYLETLRALYHGWQDTQDHYSPHATHWRDDGTPYLRSRG